MPLRARRVIGVDESPVWFDGGWKNVNVAYTNRLTLPHASRPKADIDAGGVLAGHGPNLLDVLTSFVSPPARGARLLDGARDEDVEAVRRRSR